MIGGSATNLWRLSDEQDRRDHCWRHHLRQSMGQPRWSLLCPRCAVRGRANRSAAISVACERLKATDLWLGNR